MALSNASAARVRRFVSWLLASEYYAHQWGASSDDWINDPERAARCERAAENGSDGSTHAEHIEDMRNAFKEWLDENHRLYWRTSESFGDAVNAHFDALEHFHAERGTLYQKIG
jgi:hypothetical protein